MKTSHVKTMFAGALTALALSGSAQVKNTKGDLTLTVDLTQLSYPVSRLYFTYYNTTTKYRFTDSADIGNKKIVSFHTDVDEPILAQLRVLPANDATGKRTAFARDSYSLYIEPGKLKAVAKDSLGNTEVTGSSSHKDYLALKAKAAEYDKQFEGLYQHYRQARKEEDSAGATAVRKQIEALQEQVNEKVYVDFIRQNGQRSAVALYALAQYTGYSIDPAKAQPVYDLLGPAVKGLPSGIAVAKRIEIAKHLEIGQPALGFTQNDTLERPVTLASLKGKYVLIDFWASWCGPCRAENPNVLVAFNKYKDKDFTVLGVSLDRPGQKEKWLKAIHDDQLQWTHVSDLRFWDNEVAKLYDVKAIPQNYLLDKEGRIVAKNIRGEELQSKLQELIR